MGRANARPWRGLAAIVAALCLSLLPAAAQPRCTPVDFLAVPVPAASADPALDALLLAYEGVQISPDAHQVGVGNAWMPLGPLRAVDPQQRLRAPTLREQFLYRYPLAFDLGPRRRAFEDPGRLRNESFFKALWFASEAAARASLVTVAEPRLPGASFRVTRKHGVACQLAAALHRIAETGGYGASFRQIGGSFNWRRISGTDRLSAHSFGIAVDINPQLGGYWKWAGAPVGRVGPYETKVPRQVVQAMERFGFIWGGKWHHYDGMHFEYRPELILYSRMMPD
jgi:hypothetical protein